MRESRTYGFVRGAHSDMRPYRDPYCPVRLASHMVKCPSCGVVFDEMAGKRPLSTS